ncbi:orotate phosphoribosyltransferase [Thermocladium modestius]|uniref:Orotate phosphoribosyltransferase n=1 Tax=Thermocladium modestius TaxID=62609 RepID=A0A830GZ28_9CREN|nr:orotate phosphoribosyltransferase [Thermocladium modestius]GGP21294.1 orotate phosphoribosyltransferase [Thermocladium modestius]
MNRRELIRLLGRHGVVQFGEFKLSSGGFSDYYIDMRRAISVPAIYREIIELMTGEAVGVELIAGIESGGVPWASMLAYRMGMGMIYVRKQVKEHGTARLVEGIYEPGQRVLVVDDVVTTGSSIRKGVESLKSVGLDVVKALAIVDRSGGAADAGAELRSVFSVGELLDELKDAHQ